MMNRSEEFFKKLNTKKAVTVLFIIGIIGIMLIAGSSIFSSDNDNAYVSENENALSSEEYLKKINKDIKEIVTSLSGDQSPCVSVSLDTSVHNIYADSVKTDTKDNEDTASDKRSQQKSDITENNCVIIEDSNGKQSALKVTEKMPYVRGVSIICAGADNGILANKIKMAVITFLNISEEKVYVTGK